MAMAFDKLREHLGISQIDTVIGGSLGGQVALEWSYLLQEKVKYTVIVASKTLGP